MRHYTMYAELRPLEIRIPKTPRVLAEIRKLKKRTLKSSVGELND